MVQRRVVVDAVVGWKVVQQTHERRRQGCKSLSRRNCGRDVTGMVVAA